MNDWIVPIVVALLGSPLVLLIQKGRKENQADHASVMTKLTENNVMVKSIDKKIERVDDKLDKHIDWHMNRKQDAELVIKAD